MDLTAAVRQRLHVLAARRHPHDRTPELSRGLGHHRVLGMKPGLAAEATADLRRDDVDLGGDPSRGAGELHAEVRHLGRRPHRDSTVVAAVLPRNSRLHRCDRHALVDVSAADDDVGHRFEIERRRRGSIIAWLEPCSGKICSASWPTHASGSMIAGQRVDVGPYRAGGVFRRLERLGEHHGHRLTDEAHAIDGQRRTGEVVVHLHEPVMRRDAELGRRSRPRRHRACRGRPRRGSTGWCRGRRRSGRTRPARCLELEVGDVFPSRSAVQDPRFGPPECRAPTRRR